MADMPTPERPITLKDGSKNFGDGVIGPSARDIAEVNSLKDFASNEEGSIDPKVAAGVALGAAALGVGGVIAATHQSAPAEVTNVSPTPGETILKTPAGTVKVSVPPSATPTSTAEAPKTPEAQPCQILSPELCSQAQLIHFKNSSNQTFNLIGADLPTGTPIFSPIDGQISAPTEIKQPSPYKGILGKISGQPNQPSFFLRGDIKFSNMNSKNVKKGEIIGYIQNTGIKEFDKYELVVEIDGIDQATGQPGIDNKTTQELFSDAFKKPAVEVYYDGQSAKFTNVYEAKPTLP